MTVRIDGPSMETRCVAAENDESATEGAKRPELFHKSVMLDQVLDALAPQPGQTIVDVTVGLGGHAEAICQRLAGEGRMIGIDRDGRSLEAAYERLAEFDPILTLVQARFSQVAEVLEKLGVDPVDGLLGDLGASSPQLDTPDRGFSFQQSGPLDMRMDPDQSLRAWDIVNRYSQAQLAKILWEYGEERFSRRIARRIVQARDREPVQTTDQLARIVAKAMGPRPKGARRRIHPATRTFQALRIAVNDELGELERLLRQTPDVVRLGGVAVFVSFHSLEDRLVKQAFASGAETWACEGGSPRRPTPDEVQGNPRARSAKLRAARRQG
jgi:16S rRNA (cytosine1402-N4)-methyltransferase